MPDSHRVRINPAGNSWSKHRALSKFAALAQKGCKGDESHADAWRNVELSHRAAAVFLEAERDKMAD